MAAFDVDVEVVGGGPAGAAAAIRLVALGFRTRVYDVPKASRQHVAESLPSSIRVVLRTLGIELPEDVLVERPPEHRVYWGELRGETGHAAPDGEGSLLVWRGAFDGWLQRSAIAAGVDWVEGRKPSERTGTFLVDASGRAGFWGRELREPERDFHTLALTGHFRGSGSNGVEPTLIESFERGFVWSAPLRNGLRDVTLFLDAGEKLSDYETFLAAAPEAKKLVEQATPVGPVRAADATPYRSRAYASAEHLLVGDAASFLDPLSAHGVHKAMDGALVAAAVIRTLLERPSSRADALRFYDERESRIAAVTAEKMGRLYAREIRFAERPFWRKRARVEPGGPLLPVPGPPLERAMRLGPGRGVRVENGPVLEDDYIESREVLVAPGKERPVRYLGDVCLPDLYKEVVEAGLDAVLEGSPRSQRRGRVLEAVDWLYRSGYLVRIP